MAQNEKELSNLSYTNKDFQVIYPELLDLATKLSYKWDPSTSDESDPGVVLLKLMALIGDKSNYNIDKNILELFPLSVTQDCNAREIYEQCGYRMRYYQSAKTSIQLTLTSEPEITDEDKSILDPTSSLTDIDWNMSYYNRLYTLPIFTMVANSENDIIYTITEEATLNSNGTTKSVNAIQGVITDYDINGDTLITAANIDYNNRIYFTETNIAENGIFIKNDTYDYNDWIPVDNLQIQALGTPCYKFGVTPDGSGCYIEFPSDIENLIGSGIYIKYIRTSGLDGNIGRKRITKFYVDTTASRHIITTPSNVQHNVKITNDNIYVTNEAAAVDGKNPETIDEAHKNYEKIKNTFETLVSLKDYSNYIFTNKSVSNGFVCDRTNDVQSTYNIVEFIGDQAKTHTVVKNKTVSKKDVNDNDVTIEEPELTPFDLKIYGLTYVPSSSTAFNYERSFTFITESPQAHGTLYSTALNALKSIQHDFKLPNDDEILFIKNKYPIVVNIIPQYKLDNIQQQDVRSRVITALYEKLNSRNINFGDEADYDLIYDTIIGADPRIKAIALDDLEYQTYAVFIHNNEIFELRIDYDIPETAVAGQPKYYNSYIPSIDELPYRDQINLYAKTTDEDILGPNSKYYVLDTTGKYSMPETITEDHLNINLYEEIGTSLWTKFYKEILTRSILAGNTQLLIDDNQFDYSLMQDGAYTISPVKSITTNADINFVLESIPSDVQKLLGTSNTLTEQENMMFTSPNLIKDEDYSSYVKYLHNIKGMVGENKGEAGEIVVAKNAEYTLAENEYIIFFWKPTEDENGPYSYYKYSGGLAKNEKADNKVKVISPTFPLIRQPDPQYNIAESLPELSNLPNGLGNTDLHSITVTNSYLDSDGKQHRGTENKKMVLTDYVKKLQGSNYVLTGSNTITTKKVNSIHVNNTANGTQNICWIRNNVVNGYSELFPKVEIRKDGDTFNIYENGNISSNDYGVDLLNPQAENGKYTFCQEYVLNSGEYFIYTNVSKTQLFLLQNGTKIKRYCTVAPNTNFINSSTDNRYEYYVLDSWKCPEISLTELLSEDLDYLTTRWFTIEANCEVHATEMYFEQIGPNHTISLKADFKELVDTETYNNCTTVPTSSDTEVVITDKTKYGEDFTCIWKRSGTETDDWKIDKISVNFTLNNQIRNLKNFTISYTNSEGQDKTLPERSSSELAWTGYSILNINSSSKTYQRIRDNHTISLYGYDDSNNKVLFTHLKNNNDSNDDNVLLADRFISNTNLAITGGIDVSTIMYDTETGKEINLVLYTFRILDTTIPENDCIVLSGNDVEVVTLVRNNKDPNIEHQLVPPEIDINIKCTLPAGSYILPVTNLKTFEEKDNSDYSFKLLYNEIQLSDVYDESVHTEGLHYIRFDVNSSDNQSNSNVVKSEDVNLRISITGYTKEFQNSILFGPPYKFENIDAFNDNNIGPEILDRTRISKYRVFDFTHLVEGDYLLDYHPLSSVAFMKSNHVYNKFMISQWVNDSDFGTNIKIMNKIK